MDGKRGVFPWSWPWCDINGKRLRPYQIFLSRKFSFNYLIIIWIIWIFVGNGPEKTCDYTNDMISCIGGLWPTGLFDAPLHFFTSLVIAPIFHNSNEHIIFVSVGLMIFVQSFELRQGLLQTYFLFMLFTSITAITMAVIMNTLEIFLPGSQLLASGLSRNWMGGSAGFYGIIGASAHQTKNKWVVPSIAIGFESWNHFLHGISIFTSSAHMISLISGFIIWGYWTGNLGRSQN